MAAPIVLPEYQFCDQNGIPYAGGSITTYIQGTSTPKATYLDEALTALNTNPITLDGAGRCMMWGDGDFRLVLRDALDNEIWDVPATSIVSAALFPVVSAPTIEDAVDLLGIPALIEVETARAEAAEAANAAAISAETTRAEAAEGALNTAIAAETARAEAAEAALAADIAGAGGGVGWQKFADGNMIQWGMGTTSGGGTASITFPQVFATSIDSATATTHDNSANYVIRCSALTTSGMGVFIEDTDNTGGQASGFSWVAMGH